MTPSTASQLRPILALALLVPVPLAAQEVPSMLARVEADGAPAADVAIDVYTGGMRRHLATTGQSGLAVVEFSRAPLPSGTQLLVFAVTCGNETRIALGPSAADLPVLGEECRRERLDRLVWARTQRLDIRLGDRPAASVQLAREVTRAGAGFRVQAGPVVSFLTGDFDNTEAGIGAELLGGYDAAGGAGIGVGVAFARHGLDGVDESLWRWAVMVEPRYTLLRAHWRARPYVAARVSWQSLDAEEGARLLTETGWSFGGGAGVAFPLFGGLWADLAAHAAYLTADAEGLDRSGMVLDVRAALRF